MTITNTTANERTRASMITERVARALTIPALVLAGSVLTVSLLAGPASANPCEHDPIFAEANGCRVTPAVTVSRRVANTVESQVPSNVR